jgi:hypothetical protein
MRPNTLLEQPKTEQNDLPPVGEAVIVQCPAYRCLAYRGRTNQWWDANDGTELTGVIKVVYRFCR